MKQKTTWKESMYFGLQIILGLLVVITLFDIITLSGSGRGQEAGTYAGGLVFWSLMFLLAWNAHKKIKAKRLAKDSSEPAEVDTQE